MRFAPSKPTKEEIKSNRLKVEFNILNKKRNDLLTRFKLSKNPTVQIAFGNRLKEIDERIAYIYRSIFPECEEMTTKEIFEMITSNPKSASNKEDNE